MSTLSGGARQGAGDGIIRGIGNAAVRWWVAYMAWRIQRLAGPKPIPDRRLADIGVVRSQRTSRLAGS